MSVVVPENFSPASKAILDSFLRDPRTFVKCIDIHMSHPFPALPVGGWRSTVAERVLPVPVCEGMRVGETMGTRRGFYKVFWVLQLPGHS